MLDGSQYGCCKKQKNLLYTSSTGTCTNMTVHEHVARCACVVCVYTYAQVWHMYMYM